MKLLLCFFLSKSLFFSQNKSPLQAVHASTLCLTSPEKKHILDQPSLLNGHHFQRPRNA